MYGARTGVHVGVHSTLTFTPALPLSTLVAQMFANNEQGVWYDPSDVMLTWRRNRLTYTQQFDNAVWVRLGSNVTADATTAPDGTSTADLFYEDSGTSEHRLRYSSVAKQSGETLTYSTYAKSNGTSGYLVLEIEVSGNGVASIFDLDTGVYTDFSVGAGWTRGTTLMTAVGGGWYRCSISFISNTNSTCNARCTLSNTYPGVKNPSYLGNGSRGVYLWGAQLENGTTPTTYQPITDGVQDYFTYQAQPTLYQDYQGLQPCTAIEQPVGLLLDKRQALTLGSDVVLNGDFSNGSTSWRDASSAGGSWTVTGGAAVLTNTSGIPRLRQTLTVVANRWYQFTYETSGITSTTAVLSLGNTADGSTEYYVNTALTNGSKRLMFYATNTVVYINFACNTAGVMTVDNVACKSLIGNHAYQSTSAARPTLRARYNLATYSEDVSNAAWAKIGTASASNATTMSFPSADDYLYESLTAATYAGKSMTISVELSGSGTTTIGFYDNVGGFQFDTITLTATATRYTATKTLGVGAVDVRFYPAGKISGATAATVTVTKIDVRPTNQTGTGLPDYQRIAAATDYDTVGFPAYIQGNGSSQTMLTQAIDFSATDKVTLWSGVRKVTDASSGIVVDLSVSPAVNPGSFSLQTSETLAANYSFYLIGTGIAGYKATTYTAPISNVISCLYDIGGAAIATEILPRVNGVIPTLTATSAGPAGTGNFGNYPLYLLSRGAASLWFGGNFYGLIIRGASSNDSQIQNGERYLNSKSKAY